MSRDNQQPLDLSVGSADRKRLAAKLTPIIGGIAAVIALIPPILLYLFHLVQNPAGVIVGGMSLFLLIFVYLFRIAPKAQNDFICVGLALFSIMGWAVAVWLPTK